MAAALGLAAGRSLVEAVGAVERNRHDPAGCPAAESVGQHGKGRVSPDLGGDDLGSVVGQPEPGEQFRVTGQHHDWAAGHAPELSQAGGEVLPLMDAEGGHRGVERGVREGQGFRRGVHRYGEARRVPSAIRSTIVETVTESTLVAVPGDEPPTGTRRSPSSDVFPQVGADQRFPYTLPAKMPGQGGPNATLLIMVQLRSGYACCFTDDEQAHGGVTTNARVPKRVLARLRVVLAFAAAVPLGLVGIPGPLALQARLRRGAGAPAELGEVQVGLGQPATQLRAGIGPNRSCGEVGDPPGPGELVDVDRDALKYRGHPVVIYRDDRPIRVIGGGRRFAGGR